MTKKIVINLDLLRKAIREVFGVDPSIEMISICLVKAVFGEYKLYIQCFEEYRGCQVSLYHGDREVVMCKIRCYDFENDEDRARKVTAVLRQAKIPAEYGLSWE